MIGLLYATFGFAFGIWMGINERFEHAHLHPHINLIGFASTILFGLIYRSFSGLGESRLAALHFVLFNVGAVVFLIGIPLAQARQTVVLAAGGSSLVLAAMLTFLLNYWLNAFNKPTGC